MKACARCSFADPGRAKPKGATGGWRAKPRLVVRDFRKGQSPGTAACWAGPYLLRRVGITDRLNGMWVLPTGKPADTFREEQSSEGRIP